MSNNAMKAPLMILLTCDKTASFDNVVSLWSRRLGWYKKMHVYKASLSKNDSADEKYDDP